MLGWIFKALFMNESMLIIRYKPKLSVVEPVFKALFMARLGSLWYNCIYWSRFETLSSYKSSAISDLVIIHLACTKANSYSNFVTHPPSLWRSFVVLCINKVWGITPCGAVKSVLWLPPCFWHCLCLATLFICLNLVWSSPCGAGEIRKALPIFLSHPTVVGR